MLFKLRFHDVDVSDFYSLANEIIAKAIKGYDGKQDFDGYIYRCLENKFKSEMTKRNRIKRQADRMALSLEENVGNDEDGMTVGELIADKNTIESEFFQEKEEIYSDEMKKYLGKLSSLQREVLKLISIGFVPSEILEELHINQKIYEECYNAIHSCKNIKILL